jgi:hypothetical protein
MHGVGHPYVERAFASFGWDTIQLSYKQFVSKKRKRDELVLAIVIELRELIDFSLCV